METVALMRRQVDSSNGDLGKLGASAELFPRAPGCDTKGTVMSVRFGTWRGLFDVWDVSTASLGPV